MRVYAALVTLVGVALVAVALVTSGDQLVLSAIGGLLLGHGFVMNLISWEVV